MKSTNKTFIAFFNGQALRVVARNASQAKRIAVSRFRARKHDRKAVAVELVR